MLSQISSLIVPKNDLRNEENSNAVNGLNQKRFLGFCIGFPDTVRLYDFET